MDHFKRGCCQVWAEPRVVTSLYFSKKAQSEETGQGLVDYCECGGSILGRPGAEEEAEMILILKFTK